MATTKQASATVLSDSGDNSDNGLSTELTEHPNRNFTKKSFFSWFDANDGPLERRVILKLDFFILTYAFIGFWVSLGRYTERTANKTENIKILYIDRGILANAYISGMKEGMKLPN